MRGPSIDDRNFDDLVREGLSLLPVYAPEWTDHNPSDPGITLVELLAYFSDILLYRLGRITPAAKLQFLRLLKGSEQYGFGEPGSAATADELQCAIDEAVRELAHMDCAVTPRDFERLAIAAAQRRMPQRRVRVHCIANTDLSGGRMRTSAVDARGHVSVVLAPPDDTPPYEAAQLREAVREYLLPRCLMTTRLHVVAPVVLQVGIGFKVALLPGVSMQAAQADIAEALHRRFGGTGEPDSETPAFGQPLNLSAIMAVIDRVPGIDYVENVTVLSLTTEADAPDASVGVQIGATSTVGVDTLIGGPGALGGERLIRDSEGVLASIRVKPWELLRLFVAPDGIHAVGAGDRDRNRNRRSDHG